MSIGSYRCSDRLVLESARAKEVTPEGEPRLHNVVEGLSLAAGIPKPRVYVVPEHAPNAFPPGATRSTRRSEALEARASDPDLGSSASVAFDACGGAINHVPARATAFVHRTSLFLAQYTATVDHAGSIGPNLAWLRRLRRAMRPYASGRAYQNYIDPELGDWATAYYGRNLPRLMRVKRAYDPDDLFRFPQSIPLR
jgi:FAD/FMN-containing dehydrogenase